jgi:sugar O-acyltransferase (sialic acid O-acetyltransferase NeuD family)
MVAKGVASMMRDLIIIGAGEFGREVYTWACQAIDKGAPWNFKGFLDDDPRVLQGFDYDAGVLDSVERYQPQPNDVFLCAIGKPAVKKKCCNHILGKGGDFTTLIHPTALVGPRVKVGVGSIICPFTQLSCEITLGRFVTFGTLSSSAHDTAIGDWCEISGHCGINGRAVLEEGVFLGSHVAILPGVRIRAYAYVGAGSIVLKRVKPGVKVFGNPAVTISTVDAP